ncbi:hypothetical protein B0H63DRAFT_488743 [Podospora didyma]|uniref:Uncharacterized protein n=1 Tax=Podospora didyma TaxID=330526 RepID=A0AAE0N2R0_9PEZI|nr:hypothetical protein B0H63DRAFT_488743 [Podospora didyma]
MIKLPRRFAMLLVADSLLPVWAEFISVAVKLKVRLLCSQPTPAVGSLAAGICPCCMLLLLPRHTRYQ